MALTEKRKKYLRELYARNRDKERKRIRDNQREWRKHHPIEAREKDKIKHQKAKKWEREYNRKYSRTYKQDPLKYAARTILNNAVILGKITRPKICEKCGMEKRIQAHHPDYYKPLEVMWLCSGCHALVHHPLPSLSDYHDALMDKLQ